MAEPESRLKRLAKYFVHGASFSVIGLVLSFVWFAILIVLVLLGSIIGLLIGFVVLFFFLGGLNSLLTGLIWNTSIKTDWLSLLLHGLVLFIVFIIVHIPSLAINLVAQSIVTVAVLLIIYAFVDGFLARHVASVWKEAESPPEMAGTTPKPFLKSCVNCGEDIPLASETCSHCGAEQKEKRRERLFDKKTSDTKLGGLNLDEIKAWLQGVKRVEEFEYYDFLPGARGPSESQKVKWQPVEEVLDFLAAHFTESVDSFVEVQKKEFKSGRHQVIVRKITAIPSKREITKIAVLNYNKSL